MTKLTKTMDNSIVSTDLSMTLVYSLNEVISTIWVTRAVGVDVPFTPLMISVNGCCGHRIEGSRYGFSQAIQRIRAMLSGIVLA